MEAWIYGETKSVNTLYGGMGGVDFRGRNSSVRTVMKHKTCCTIHLVMLNTHTHTFPLTLSHSHSHKQNTKVVDTHGFISLLMTLYCVQEFVGVVYGVRIVKMGDG